MGDDEPTYGLVMPFVVCESQGGPWQDAAFVAGYEMGSIDQDPTLVESTGRYIHTPSVPQADLIAMRHGLTCEVGDTDESGEWTFVRFRNPTPSEPVPGADDSGGFSLIAAGLIAIAAGVILMLIGLSG